MAEAKGRGKGQLQGSKPTPSFAEGLPCPCHQAPLMSTSLSARMRGTIPRKPSPEYPMCLPKLLGPRQGLLSPPAWQ